VPSPRRPAARLVPARSGEVTHDGLGRGEHDGLYVGDPADGEVGWSDGGEVPEEADGDGEGDGDAEGDGEAEGDGVGDGRGPGRRWWPGPVPVPVLVPVLVLVGVLVVSPLQDTRTVCPEGEPWSMTMTALPPAPPWRSISTVSVKLWPAGKVPPDAPSTTWPDDVLADHVCVTPSAVIVSSPFDEVPRLSTPGAT
jgi:hypothetical protein